MIWHEREAYVQNEMKKAPAAENRGLDSAVVQAIHREAASQSLSF